MVMVKDIMVSLEDYATVSQEAFLFEAVLALNKAQEEFDQNRYRHRAVLALDENNRVVGKLGQIDVLKGLEPGYRKMGDIGKISHWGLSKYYIRSMMESQNLWQKPLDNICSQASQIKVKDIMYTPAEGEYVDEDASLNEAIHQLVIGRHQALLVTRGEEVVGILRLTDVFKEVVEEINKCEI